MAILKIKDETGKYIEIPYFKGTNGKTPIKGVDYFTEEDKAEMAEDLQSILNNKDRITDFIQNTDISRAYDEATGANYTVIRVYKDKLNGKKQYPFVVSPFGADPGKLSTYQLCQNNSSYLLAINAGVFNLSDRKPDGIVIENGVVIQDGETTTHSKCQPLVIDKNGDLSSVAYNASASDLVANGIVSAVVGFVPIIKDYAPVPQSEWNTVSHYTENTQRQIIGQFGNGDYAIVTCEGRGYQNSDGWTLAEAQTVCKKLGLKFAYNLDGGGSTETMLGKKHFNTIYEETMGRIVPTFIVFNGTTSFDSAVAPEPEVVTYFAIIGGTVYQDSPMTRLALGTDTSGKKRCSLSQSSPSSITLINSSGIVPLYTINVIEVPQDATGFTLNSNGMMFSYALFTGDNITTTKILDSGWTSPTTAGSYSFTKGVCQYLAINFKHSDNADLTQSEVDGIKFTFSY